MAIPNGYRLLTSADVGKTFGVDLELEVYIDTSIDIDSITKSFSIMNFWEDINLTNFLVFRRESNDDGDEYYYTYIKDNSNTYIINYDEDDATYWWELSQYTFTENVEITSFNTDGNWNTWFYVKDIEINDPYNIVIKNKEGIKLLTKDKTIEFTDDVNVTIDESLLGGGGSSGGVDLDYNITIKICSNSGTFGSGFSYSLDYGKTWEYKVPSGDPDEIWTYASYIEANKGVQSSGDYIPTEKFACILVRFNTSSASVGVSSNAGYIKLYGNNSYQVYLITADTYAEVEATLSASGGGAD